MNMRNIRIGSNGLGMPAMSDPITMRNMPASTALMVPEMLNPATSSSFVIGVTRYPSCSPRALSSMKMMPPPIITIMKIDITIDPGSRYCTYGTYGYTSTTSSVACPEMRGALAGWL